MTQAAPEDRIARRTLAPGVRVAITGRSGGVSKPPYDTLNLGRSVGDDPAAVARNRLLLAESCGVEPSRVTWMRQVHGADVTCVAGPVNAPPGGGQPIERPCPGQHQPPGPHQLLQPQQPLDQQQPPGQQAPGQQLPGRYEHPECDAVYTAVRGLPLSVLAADCAPVLVADPAAGLIGAAHAGRAGMEAGVVPALIGAMTGAGADAARMRALIGPAVCGGCYNVPDDLRERVSAAVPAAYCVTRRGLPGLDITAGIEAQLAAAGVRDVQRDGRCTAESPELYSHRRDRLTGRFAALIWLA